MVKRIYYFLYDELENKTYKIDNDTSIILYIIKGNKEYLTSPRPGTRAYAVYMDKQLNTKAYRDWIDACIKPMLSFMDSEGICFI